LISASITNTNTISVVKRVSKILNIPVTATIGLTKRVSKLIPLVITGTVNNIRSITKRISITNTNTIAALKRISKTIGLGVTLSINVDTSTALDIFVEIVNTNTIAIQKRINKIIALPVTMTLGLNKLVYKIIRLNPTLSVTVLDIFTTPLSFDIISTMAVAVTVTFIAAGDATVRIFGRFIGRFWRWISGFNQIGRQ
jgi:hypothetical protein